MSLAGESKWSIIICELIWNFLSRPIVREILITVVLALVIFFAARATIQTYEVFQTSMEPSFSEGQRVVVVKAIYWWGEPQRGDVVIFHAPDGSNEEYIKRVVGVPGDTVEIAHGIVFINGFRLDDPMWCTPPGILYLSLSSPVIITSSWVIIVVSVTIRVAAGFYLVRT